MPGQDSDPGAVSNPSLHPYVLTGHFGELKLRALVSSQLTQTQLFHIYEKLFPSKGGGEGNPRIDALGAF